MLRILARATVSPTEDEERVRAALLSLFPGAAVRREDGALVAEPRDLERFRELVRSERIPDSARGVMLAGLAEDGLRARFHVGKQAAAAGRAHFGALREPLGSIEVALWSDVPGEVERALYHVAPDTTVPLELAEVPPSLRPKADEGRSREAGDDPADER
jgi:predicted RNA binding protein with dsRBD fold (UPF0201 family)